MCSEGGGQSVLRWAVPKCQSDLVMSELLCSYYSGNSQKLQNNQIFFNNTTAKYSFDQRYHTRRYQMIIHAANIITRRNQSREREVMDAGEEWSLIIDGKGI